MKITWSFAFAAIAGASWIAAPAAAQPLGSFRWQLQPYCNVITLTVVQQGGQYQLDGIDDQCGAGQSASVRGMAFANLNGTIGFGLTIVTAPGGTPVHVDATITFPGLNGTWRDSAGNVGNLIFGAGLPGGGPRPVPTGGLAPGSVRTIQIASAAVTNAQIAANAVTGANIANASVTTVDLAAPPALEFQPSTYAYLTPTVATVRQVSIVAPAAGKVMVTVSGNFQGLDANHVDTASCSLGASTAIDGLHRVEFGKPTAAGYMFIPFSITRVFTVGAGTFTAYFNCSEFSGDVAVYDVLTTALFIGS